VAGWREGGVPGLVPPVLLCRGVPAPLPPWQASSGSSLPPCFPHPHTSTPPHPFLRRAKEPDCGKVDAATLLLVDSGGQYDCGTTDITRTFHFGRPSEHQRRCYTRVLQGHIALDRVRGAGTSVCAVGQGGQCRAAGQGRQRGQRISWLPAGLERRAKVAGAALGSRPLTWQVAACLEWNLSFPLCCSQLSPPCLLPRPQAVFPEGTPGCALDTLARTPLWSDGLNYRHGTGHGGAASRQRDRDALADGLCGPACRGPCPAAGQQAVPSWCQLVPAVAR
jgi:hypothetical protein